MDRPHISNQRLAESVIAVPPLARAADLTLAAAENRRIIRHLEAGGVTTLLYGGNAILYHLPLSQYAALLELLTGSAGASTLVIPSVGPAFGMMMDQAAVLRDFDFATAMILPQREVSDSDGIASGVRRFVEAFGRPAVLYIKHDGYLPIDTVRRLSEDGLLDWIKYAVVREDPSRDDYLKELVQVIDARRVISGMGEQPAVVHLRDFGLGGFTSGCVCVAPRLAMQMLRALQAGDFARGERIRTKFAPLEDLRNRINPIRVLHAAVSLAGIADTGPVMPLLSDIDPADRPAIAQAAGQLLASDGDHVE